MCLKNQGHLHLKIIECHRCWCGKLWPPDPLFTSGEPILHLVTIWKYFVFFCCPFILINHCLIFTFPSHTCSHKENTFCNLPYSTQPANNIISLFQFAKYLLSTHQTFGLSTFTFEIIEDLLINSHLTEENVCQNLLPHFFWPHN